MPDDIPTFAPVEGRSREEVVPLAWPLECGGRRIDAIVVRRLTVAQVRAFDEALSADAEALPDMLFMADGAPVTRAILDALDADDDERLAEAMDRFLPRRLRAGGPTPAAGDYTSPALPAA